VALFSHSIPIVFFIRHFDRRSVLGEVNPRRHDNYVHRQKPLLCVPILVKQ
jgi:hypothetical protein